MFCYLFGSYEIDTSFVFVNKNYQDVCLWSITVLEVWNCDFLCVLGVLYFWTLCLIKTWTVVDRRVVCLCVGKRGVMLCVGRCVALRVVSLYMCHMLGWLHLKWLEGVLFLLLYSMILCLICTHNLVLRYLVVAFDWKNIFFEEKKQKKSVLCLVIPNFVIFVHR